MKRCWSASGRSLVQKKKVAVDYIFFPQVNKCTLQKTSMYNLVASNGKKDGLMWAHGDYIQVNPLYTIKYVR